MTATNMKHKEGLTMITIIRRLFRVKTCLSLRGPVRPCHCEEHIRFAQCKLRDSSPVIASEPLAIARGRLRERSNLKNRLGTGSAISKRDCFGPTSSGLAMTVALVLLLVLGTCLTQPAYAADKNIEFGVEDDLTVLGTEGTDSDPDIEVKGYTAFATTAATADKVTSGAGSVYMQGNLEVDGASYFDNAMSVSAAGDTNIAHDLYFSNATASQISSNKALTIISGSPGTNSNLTLKGTGTGKVYIDDDLQIADGYSFSMQNLSIPSTGAITFGGDATLQRSSADTLSTATGDNLLVSGNLTVNGSTTLGDGTDNLTVNTNQLFVQGSTGYVGIGTVSPAQKSHVEGQCVTGDTLLPILREVKGQGSRAVTLHPRPFSLHPSVGQNSE